MSSNIINKHPEHPEDYIWLSSAQCHLHMPTADTYSRDFENRVGINEIEIGDWFRSLSDEDWIIMQQALPNIKNYSKESIAAFVDNREHGVTIQQIVNDPIRQGDKQVYTMYPRVGNIYYVSKRNAKKVD